MAYKKNYRKRAGKKHYKKKGRKQPSRSKTELVRIKTPASIVPDRMRVKLEYNQLVPTSGAAPAWQYIFRGNSMYDPDYAIGGGQPVGFDQMKTLYNRYEVSASSIIVKVLNCGTTTGSYTRVAVYPSLSTGTLAMDAAIANPYSTHKLISANAGMNEATLRNYISTKKIFGEMTLVDDDYSALVAVNPVNTWYWQINAESIDKTTNLANNFYDVLITYYVDFSERVPLVDV